MEPRPPLEITSELARESRDPRRRDPAVLLDRSEETAVDGVLRWLVAETEAEAAAYVSLRPGGHERLLVRPRGLPSRELADLVGRARDAMVDPAPAPTHQEASIERWLGAGATKVLLLKGVVAARGQPALRFAHYLIEWLTAGRAREGQSVVERRAREVPGVVWAEISGDPPVLRVLLAPGVDRVETCDELTRALGDSHYEIVEVAEGESRRNPRARLIELVVTEGEQVSADVVIEWRGTQVRGRGHGDHGAGGRAVAAATAVTDAMKPLLDMDVSLEALYRSETANHHAILVATVSVGGDRFVGAVPAAEGQESHGGARAVLDALNRRLPEMAGKAGRI